jgi:hypothetical protein
MRSLARYNAATGEELQLDSNQESLKGSTSYRCCVESFWVLETNKLIVTVFTVVDAVKLKPAKNSIQLKLRNGTLNSVRELHEWDALPLVPADISIAEINVDDKVLFHNPCELCGEGTGPRCMWICCGLCACANCALLLYSAVNPFGLCSHCGRVFPPGWTVDDMLVTPPVPLEKITHDHVLKVRQKARERKNDMNAEFKRTRSSIKY